MTGDRTVLAGGAAVRRVLAELAPDALDSVEQLEAAYAAAPRSPRRLQCGGWFTGARLAGVIPIAAPVLIAVTAQVMADLAAGAVRRGGGAGLGLLRRRAQAAARARALTGPVLNPGEVGLEELTRWVEDFVRTSTDLPRPGFVAAVVAVAVLGLPQAPVEDTRPAPAGIVDAQQDAVALPHSTVDAVDGDAAEEVPPPGESVLVLEGSAAAR